MSTWPNDVEDRAVVRVGERVRFGDIVGRVAWLPSSGSILVFAGGRIWNVPAGMVEVA